MKIFNQYRFRLTIYLFLLVLIPLLVTSIITLTITNREIERNVYTKNEVIIEGLKNTISSRMEGVEASLSSIAKSTSILSMNPKDMDSILKETVDAQSIISQMYVTDATGMQIYKTSGELGDRSDREYFSNAMNGNSNYSDILISGSTGKPIVVFAVPIYNQSKVVGTLGASIELEFISELANSIKVSPSGYGFAVDSNGFVIAHKDSTKVANQEDLSNFEPVAKAITGLSGFGEYDYEGQLSLITYTNISNTNWGLVVLQPESEAFKSARDLKNLVSIIIIIASIGSVIIAFFLANSVIKPLKIIEGQMAIAKEGRLSIQLPANITKRKDEFGQLARNILDTMKSIAGIIQHSKNVTIEVNEAAIKLNSMATQTKVLSSEITNAVDEIARGATEQASDSEKSATLTALFDEKFKELLSKSKQMNEEVGRVSLINKDSKIKMDELEVASKVSKTSTEQVETAIKALELKSSSISDILGTITSISNQTNLLALNASIEAARAGEHGRGFAVVAEEIRKLAEGSSQAASEIGEIITNIRAEISSTVELMGTVTEVSAQQSYSVGNVNEAFEMITTSVSSISENIQHINGFVESLSTDNTSIVEAISSISSVSEETAAASEEVSASVTQQLESVEEVAIEAQNLQVLSDQLKSDIALFIID